MNKEANFNIIRLFNINRRTYTLYSVCAAIAILLIIALCGVFMDDSLYAANFAQKNLPPSFNHFFGTDWMGRDMFFRTIKGLSTSMVIGTIASVVASIMAIIIGAACALKGKYIESIFNWFVDLFMGVPHLILLILISVILGKGLRGVMIGVILTHWCSLSRIVRAEVLSLKTNFYVQVSRKFGKSSWFIIRKHIIPHVVPSFIVGIILLFPHAIMHEASITFLGFGLPPELPAIGVILSESMRYITSGMWWLSVFPGLTLLFILILFESIGQNIKTLIDPFKAQE